MAKKGAKRGENGAPLRNAPGKRGQRGGGAKEGEKGVKKAQKGGEKGRR